MQWIDFVVLAILASAIYCGYKKGFFVTAVELLKWIATLVISRLFYRPFTDYVIKNIYDPTPQVSKHVRNYLYDYFKFDPLIAQNMTVEQTQTSVNALTLPEHFLSQLKETLSNGLIERTVDFVDVLTQNITELIVSGIGFVVLLLLLFIGFGVFQWFGTFLSKLPIFKELNQGGGIIVGAILGVVIVYALMAVVTFFPTFAWSQKVILSIESSKTAIYFYKYNILMYAFQSFIQIKPLMVTLS